MCRVTARDSRCEHCSRFSHCNNNDLVCLSKFRELERILDEYEGYGGALDEGKAWADEAMASREKFEKVQQGLNELKERIKEVSNGIIQLIKQVED